MVNIDANTVTPFYSSYRYLQEYTALGTAGGIYHFRDQIRAGSADAFFLVNGDVCGDFPLQEMLQFHQSRPGKGPLVTLLGTEATRQQSCMYGCIGEVRGKLDGKGWVLTLLLVSMFSNTIFTNCIFFLAQLILYKLNTHSFLAACYIYFHGCYLQSCK